MSRCRDFLPFVNENIEIQRGKFNRWSSQVIKIHIYRCRNTRALLFWGELKAADTWAPHGVQQTWPCHQLSRLQQEHILISQLPTEFLLLDHTEGSDVADRIRVWLFCLPAHANHHESSQSFHSGLRWPESTCAMPFVEMVKEREHQKFGSLSKFLLKSDN